MKGICSFGLFLVTAALWPLSLFAQDRPNPEIKWDRMDLGSFQSGTFKIKDQIIAKGIAIKVGDPADQATVLFDPELMRISAAWTGGFIKFPRGRGGLEGQIAPDGVIRFSTAYAPGWSAQEIDKDPRENHQGNLPRAIARWHGLYTHGANVVLRYAIHEVPVFEMF